MKIVFISHCIFSPTKEGIEANLADLRRIIRKINLEHPDILPLCAYYADVVSLDDNVPQERARGIKNSRTLLESGVFHEVWLTGPRLSDGMIDERNIALIEMISVIDYINRL